MNTKERLIEALKKDNWFVHIYNDKNRAYCFLNLLTNLNKEWLFGLHPKHFLPEKLYLYSRKEYDNIKETNCPSLTGTPLSDLTQLFNDYLEEYEPNVWMHSVLAARELGLKVEIKSYENEWCSVNKYSCLSYCFKYRIEHKTEKLVPDEIWDILDDNIASIAKNPFGVVFGFSHLATLGKKKLGWIGGGKHVIIQGLKCMKNAKIHNVNWEESLCIRPAK